MNSICGRICIHVAAIHKIGRVWCDQSDKAFESFGGYADKMIHHITSYIILS
jgi:hypothetical protein